MSEQSYQTHFEIMKDIVLACSSGMKLSETARAALKNTAGLFGLSAARLILWNKDYESVLTETYADSVKEEEHIDVTEKDLFLELRKKRDLVSAYVSLGGREPTSSFTLPIRKGGEILGAVIGIQKGADSLVRADMFLEALAAGLSVAVIMAQMEEILSKERLNVVTATAATITHEVNNQLQAILGNVQVLLREQAEHDDKSMKKLKVIEESAGAIMRTMRRLMNVSEVKFTEYVNGTDMLMLPEDEDSS
jgi:signal transduction histidine kinase